MKHAGASASKRRFNWKHPGFLTARFRSEWEDGSRWYLQLSLVRKGTMLVIFQSGCPWEDRQEGRSSFDRVVESIMFDE